MQQDTSGSTSRRTFLKYGLATTGVILGPSNAGAASGDTRGNADSSRPLEQGLMRSYQCMSNSRITVGDAINWQPTGLEGTYQTYVISYDHAPSYQALLFADDGRDGATPGPEGNGDGRPETEARTGALRSGDTLSLGSVRGSPSETNHRYVTVGLEDGGSGDPSLSEG